MSSYFRLRPKLLVGLFIYMLLVYGFSSAFAFGTWESVDMYTKELPEYYYRTGLKDSTTVEQEATENITFWGEIFGFIMLAVGVTLLVLPGGQPFGLAVIASYALGGALTLGGGLFIANSLSGNNLGIISDVCEFGYLAFQSIVTFFSMLFNFLTFQVFLIGENVIVPKIADPVVSMILFLLVLPCWLLILFWIVPISIEALKAVANKVHFIK